MSMSILRGILLLAILAFAPTVSGGNVSAAPVTVNGGQLEVKARVLPVHTIVVDEQGVITQIFSNTEGEATPRVYRLSIIAANEQPMTPEIQDEYRRLLPTGSGRIGVLYARNSFINLLEVPHVSLFPDNKIPLFTLR
jgi:hypothetical protein